MKGILIGVGAVISVIIMSICCVQCSQNQAIALEEQVSESKSFIDTQQKRREDLFGNLVSCVKKYSEHEAETLKSIIAERGGSGNIKSNDLKTMLNAVHENYPQLKADAQFTKLIDEISMTENKIANVRNNYNRSAKEYKRFVRKFPTRLFLDITGYEIVEYEYLDYDSSADAPKISFE